MHNHDSQPLKTVLKRDMILPGNQAIGTPIALAILRVRGAIQRYATWMASVPFHYPMNVFGSWLTRSVGSRKAKGSRNMRCIMALQQNFALANNPLCLPTLRKEPALKVLSSTFRQNHHVPPELMCLQTGDVPILCSLSQM